MRLSVRSGGIYFALAISSPFLSLVSATPYPRDRLHDAGYGYLFGRDTCTTPCGINDQYCCEGGLQCTTLPGSIATCLPPQAALDVYTTTWTETHVYTRTIANTYEVYTTEVAIAQCVPANSQQTACGSVCCGGWQTCAWDGQCLDRSSAISGAIPIPTTISGVPTTQYSAPYRPTSIPTSTTTTVASTGTVIGAVGGDGDGLSGGAIAGIVIGVIAGVILLLLLCACCLVKGAMSTFLGLFKKKRKDHHREKIVTEEERYVRHGSAAHAHRDNHGSWYSDRPSGAGARKKEGKGLFGAAAGLGTLALLLGLKKHSKSKPARSRSSYSSSYLTDSYTGSSPSSASTRRTRQTRGSRGTRRSRTTRSSRRSSRR